MTHVGSRVAAPGAPIGFGTFLRYMLTCIMALVAFREHHSFNGFKHMFVPLFGLVANAKGKSVFVTKPAAVTQLLRAPGHG